MAVQLFLLALPGVGLPAIARTALKIGVSASGLAAALAGGGRVAAALTATVGLYVAAGLGLCFLGAVVLSQVDASVACPFVGIGSLLTAAFAVLRPGGSVSPNRSLGTGTTVALGAYLVAQS